MDIRQFMRSKSISDSRSRKQFGQKISEVSSVQQAQTNERAANVVVDSSSPFQTHLCGVHIDNDIYTPIQQRL